MHETHTLPGIGWNRLANAFICRFQPLRFAGLLVGGRPVAMRWNPLLVGALGILLACCSGPGRGITGNDTGGIIPYSPDIDPGYREMADGHCARWGRLAHITSVHRKYGDYIGFSCIDDPAVIH
jgi:hypothetical protein